jgi:methylmalonyl-CoA mutase cobalamin-binding domain/chain
MGTVQGDMHDLGKNIVVAFLKTVGFEIMDVGIDASPSKLIDAAKEFDADIIGASALLTTTMPYQKALIEHLEARNLRDKYKVIVGGGPVNQEWADEIGADGYANDAAEAAKLCVSMMTE